VEVYSKAAIVGINGEMEHGAVWHEAGGWAMREVLGNPKAMVPAVKAVASAGYRVMVPVHYIHASYEPVAESPPRPRRTACANDGVLIPLAQAT
jgi:hypothetical protein